MNLVNGVHSDAVSVYDRGLAYGDGVFRTLLVRGGRPLFWERHYAKLASDCAALRIPAPSRELLERDIAHVASQEPDGVIKIIITRGNAARGYAIPAAVVAQRIVLSAPLPDYPNSYADGVRVRICATRLSAQPRLAGIKHLNRLENVLARSEWSAPEIAEGLMCDADGNVICGTMSNVFLVCNGELLTPDLARCGVAGVQRERVLELARANQVPARIALLSREDVLSSAEVFVVNSVIGIWPVISLEDCTWKAGQVTARVRKWLALDEQH